MATHNASVLLRKVSQFDRRDLANSRKREEEIRARWRSHLEDLPRSNGIHRARVLLEIADAGVESPAESILLWSLRCILPRSIDCLTQYPVVLNQHVAFVDLAIPEKNIGFEVSGFGKFGSSTASAQGIGRRLIERQQELQDLGWQVINLTYEQVRDPVRLIAYLTRTLSRLGVSVVPPQQPRWADPTADLFKKSRRF